MSTESNIDFYKKRLEKAVEEREKAREDGDFERFTKAESEVNFLESSLKIIERWSS